ncbi:hypothetical protein [Natrialba hulunbeirensis]|uniref:hypothetical protein n=1 Tax=Natrialba hulunbeirensis TaxID=123783 RepID=UPI0009FF1FFC|nr:hypothetical protein [Natrialba hulunbeirensis]
MNDSKPGTALAGIGLSLAGITMYLQQNLIAAFICMLLVVFSALQLVSEPANGWVNENLPIAFTVLGILLFIMALDMLNLVPSVSLVS